MSSMGRLLVQGAKVGPGRGDRYAQIRRMPRPAAPPLFSAGTDVKELHLALPVRMPVLQLRFHKSGSRVLISSTVSQDL